MSGEKIYTLEDNPATKASVIEWTGLSPIATKDRHGKPWHVGGLWFAAQLVPTALFLGVLGGPSGLGLSYGAAAGAIVLGNILGAAGPAAMSLTGPKTGLPLLAQARVPFGRATGIVGILAAMTSVAFIALGAIFGAEALQVAFGLHPTIAVLLVFALEGLISVAGYRIMHLFERSTAILVAAGFVFISIIVLVNLASIPASATSGSTSSVGAFFLMAAISFGFAFGWAHNAPDYCRYLPATTSRPKLFWATFGGIALACIWMELLGLTASTMLSDSAPMAAINTLVGGGAVGVFIMVAMYLGVVANATVAQYSAGLQILGAGVKLPRPVVTAIVAAFAFALTLYLQSGNLADKFTNVLLLATYWVGPFIGIWLILWISKPDHEAFMRTATTPVARLHSGRPAIIALVAGYLLSLPFSSTAVGSELAESHNPAALWVGSISRGVLDGADLAYPIGLIFGAIIYRLLTRKTAITEPSEP
ncbi:cytosine permease [Arthrobacter sp. 2MCAF15]|uniref:purine-cytosine permease family protein n=1 Tax=Arthrobacter sp. 2MCAF15 TaxID=3232984 RepID=UPI003F929D5F